MVERVEVAEDEAGGQRAGAAAQKTHKSGGAEDVPNREGAPAQKVEQHPSTGTPATLPLEVLVNLAPPRALKGAIALEARYRGCLLGLAIGDAVAVARGSLRDVRSLSDLNTVLGGAHGALNEQAKEGKGIQLEILSGLFDVAVGGWSHATASCVATAQSTLSCKALNTRDMMMRLLRMYRTGRGSCVPGHSAGIDEASVQALHMFERSCKLSGEVYGCSSLLGAGSGALARVPAVVLFSCPHAEQAVAAAAENVRATHDVLATSDAARYMAAVLCAIMSSSAPALATKAAVLRRRQDSVSACVCAYMYDYVISVSAYMYIYTIRV
jgi:ADP-ribosylglycohydrolase